MVRQLAPKAEKVYVGAVIRHIAVKKRRRQPAIFTHVRIGLAAPYICACSRLASI